MLESTTKLIMDDESSHKPDDIRSISARSHREHLNDEEIDEIGKHQRKGRIPRILKGKRTLTINQNSPTTKTSISHLCLKAIGLRETIGVLELACF